MSETQRIPTLAGRVRPAYLSVAIGDKAVTVQNLRRVFVNQRVSAMETHARVCARKLAGVVRGKVEVGKLITGIDRNNAFSNENVPTWRGMLRQYGCEPSLIDYALSCAEQLLQQRGVVS